jgi:hypothetical protein
MSINNFTDAVGFSISGLQNIALDSINGNPILSTIIIAGQTAFLSWDNTTNTLTLFIPTSDGVVALGLLSATDWNTFNNKENGLTFISPLRRSGDVIDFDFSTANIWTGTQTYTNDIYYTSGNYFYTGLPNVITTNALYVDPITGQLSYGTPTNLLPLDNIWTGINTFQSSTTFQGQVNTRILRIENLNDVAGDIVQIFTNSFVNDYWFFNHLGGFGFVDNVGGLKYLINKDGTSTFYGLMSVDGIQINNSYLSMNNSKIFMNDNGIYLRTGGDENHGIKYNNSYDCPRIFGYGAGAEFGRQQGSYIKCAVIGTSTHPMEIFRDFVNAPSDKWEFKNNGEFRYTPPTGGGWAITSSNLIMTQGTITINNITDRNELNFTEFEPSPLINSWIATTHSDGTLSNDLDGDKVVIGNIYIPTGGAYGATIGAHNYALNEWRTLYVNLGGITIMPTLIVTVSFTDLSDRRLKDEIRYLDSGKSIDFIKRLKPCIYKRVDKRNIVNFQEPEPKLRHGFIANEIEEIAVTEAQKNLVDTTEYNGYKDCKKLAILNLIPEIVQANKEMIYKIERLETENKLLLERINAMTNVEERLLKIENIIKNKKCIALI